MQLASVDITSRNVSGARLSQVVKKVGRRVQVIALQELRTLRAPSWARTKGYVIVWKEREGRESGVATAIRNDLLKKYTLKVFEVRRHYIQLMRKDDEFEAGVGCMYMPPEASRYSATRRRARCSTWRGRATSSQAI